ncbi:MAG TPA: DUF2934 domain-containing protein [Burkholderiales bacterium]
MSRAQAAGDGRGTYARPSPEERRRMIAEAAYYKALNRGFQGGDPVEDWLAAEREIDAMFPNPEQQREEADLYEKLRAALKDLLAEAQAVNADTLRQAFERATADLKRTGRYTAETIAKVAASLRKDIASTAVKLGPRWEDLSRRGGDLFEVWRDRGAIFLSQAATAVGEWLRQTGTRFGQQTYRAGEMVYKGAFECTACGERLTLPESAHLPPCPRCQALEYRRH